MGWKRAIGMSWEKSATAQAKSSIFIFFVVSIILFVFKTIAHIKFYWVMIYFVGGLFLSSILIGIPSTLIGYLFVVPFVSLAEITENNGMEKFSKTIYFIGLFVVFFVTICFQVLSSYYIANYFVGFFK